MVDLVGGTPTRRRLAADTSSLQRYLAGESGTDTAVVEAALANGDLLLPPLVLTEVLSDPALSLASALRVREIPLLDVMPGYWARAGLMRAMLMPRKAKVPDVLIAQSCIDHDIPLITYDRDFRHFRDAGLIVI